MKPVDFRNATFEQLKSRIAGQRALVFAAWQRHGPATTEELAARAAMSILSVRPRTTELFQLGFLALDAEQPAAGAGRYRARSEAELSVWFAEQHRTAVDPQRQLTLN